MSKMADTIKKLRLQKGLTQEELGNVIGVQKSAIRKYESGAVQNIKRSSIKKLADFFGVSPSYILGYEEESQDDEVYLTEGEQMLLDLFRLIPEEQKDLVITMIKAALGNI